MTWPLSMRGLGVDRICVHTFLPGFLHEPGAVVVDLGANRGEFSHPVASRYGCRVHAVEADPRLLSVFPDNERVSIHNYCIAPNTGPAMLRLPSQGDARLAQFGDKRGRVVCVEGVTYSELLRRLGIDEMALLKIDIERAELSLFEQTLPEMIQRARQITVEFHDWQYEEDQPRVKKTIRRLKEIGFWYIPFSFNHGDVLFVSRNDMRWWEFIYFRYVVRYIAAAARVLKRR